MKTKFTGLSIIMLLLFYSCSDITENDKEAIVIAESQKEPLTTKAINEKIRAALQAQHNFNWSEQTNHFLWSAITRGNNIVTIGFGNNKNDFDRSKLADNKAIENEILAIILKYEDRALENVIISSDPYLNLIDVMIYKQETIIALRNFKSIRYIEPADYRFYGNTNDQRKTNSSSGCGLESEILSAADHTTITPNAKVPWNFYLHNIPNAWNFSTGRGITIGVIDTGLTPSQSLMNSNFNDGLSTGRFVQKYGTYVSSIWPWSTTTDGPNDQCGHGTSMASVATAPRNDNGLPVGVAYNANLITYRAAANVVLEGFREQDGVKNAFTGLANRADVKIISMSMGYIFSVGKIEDGIRFAYSKGKLIFCAGGTSTTFTTFVGIIFPASMSETVAVTGTKEGALFQKCDVCHVGNKIDFTVIMQRSGSGNTIPHLSYYDNQSDYVGGSSVATATTAGIAALVWSKNPTWTRDQVLTKMKQSSSFYPNKNPQFGHGNINALLAVQ